MWIHLTNRKYATHGIFFYICLFLQILLTISFQRPSNGSKKKSFTQLLCMSFTTLSVCYADANGNDKSCRTLRICDEKCWNLNVENIRSIEDRTRLNMLVEYFTKIYGLNHSQFSQACHPSFLSTFPTQLHTFGN